MKPGGSIQPTRIRKEEFGLWLDYIRTNPYYLHNPVFEVPIVPTEKSASWILDGYKRDWDLLNAPRADVIVKGILNKDFVVELKVSADFNTLAQVMAYKALAETFGIVTSDAEMLIITRNISNTNRYLADMSGIKIHRLQP